MGGRGKRGTTLVIYRKNMNLCGGGKDVSLGRAVVHGREGEARLLLRSSASGSLPALFYWGHAISKADHKVVGDFLLEWNGRGSFFNLQKSW